MKALSHNAFAVLSATLALVAWACAGTPQTDAGGGDDTAADLVAISDANDANDAFVAVDARDANDSGSCGAIDPNRWPDAALPDGRVIHGPYATRVVSMTLGTGGGFGQSHMPDVVLGPPVGSGDMAGGTDVFSLGAGGTICLAFDDVAIIDGPGVDFLVFENPFYAAGTANVFDELGEVSVSDDGVTYHTFPCSQAGPPYTGCAGWNPVYSRPGNGICANDVVHAGGDPFDLATLGIQSARYVCIRDLRTQPGLTPTAGFDLDAMSAVNWQ